MSPKFIIVHKIDIQKFHFQGNTDIEQLALVIRTLGTPTDTWPEVTSLPDYNKIR